MQVNVHIHVMLEHTIGKFIARDELVEALIDEVQGVGTLFIDDTEHEIADAWEVEPPAKGAA